MSIIDGASLFAGAKCHSELAEDLSASAQSFGNGQGMQSTLPILIVLRQAPQNIFGENTA
jgi:hypothetical protein